MISAARRRFTCFAKGRCINMWCPICKKELTTEEKKCPDCGTRLKKEPPNSSVAGWFLSFKDSLSDNWPYLENGQPEKPALLAHRSSVNMEDRLLINMLTAYNIPVVYNYPENGATGKILLGISGYGMDIYVPESLLEDAKALMEGAPDD